ncbi:hypothetical protein [Cohnella pontilimi]|uniref:hypothetical protein n=1 Tax=Cohnella pontilimi TaxID=2564100 RepID=UPI00145E4321|nr:hypothetical protein [Cohnella pontilimi]
MNTGQHQSEADHQDKIRKSAQFKAFVEGTGDAWRHPEREEQRAAGTRGPIDQQNKLIDQHNQRK